MNRDMVDPLCGRYIGAGRDKSGPTGAASVHTTPVISLQFIIQAEKLDSIFLEDQGPHLGANGNLLEIC